MSHKTLIVRAFLGVALAAPCAWAADRPADRPTAQQVPALPPGFATKDAKDADNIRQRIGSVVSDAMTKGDFKTVLGDFASTGVKRSGSDISDADLAKLDGRLDEISKAFRAKYGQDFDLTKDISRTIFADCAITQGEVVDPAAALTSWPVAASSGDAMKAAAIQPADANADPKAQRAAESEAKLTKGRDVALMQIPATEKCPGLTVSLIQQFPDRWLLDVPTDRTAQEIYSNMLTHLTYIGDHSEQWPADANMAYRMVSHHVLTAIYGVDVPLK